MSQPEKLRRLEEGVRKCASNELRQFFLEFVTLREDLLPFDRTVISWLAASACDCHGRVEATLGALRFAIRPNPNRRAPSEADVRQSLRRLKAKGLLTVERRLGLPSRLTPAWHSVGGLGFEVHLSEQIGRRMMRLPLLSPGRVPVGATTEAREMLGRSRDH